MIDLISEEDEQQDDKNDDEYIVPAVGKHIGFVGTIPVSDFAEHPVYF
jgi:hypothetical protein